MSTRLDEAREALDRARAERDTQAAAARTSLFEAVDAAPSGPAPVVASIASVERNASKEWNRHALDAVRRAAAEHAELTTETVWQYVTEPVHDSRAIGAVMRRAARAGLIRVTDRFVLASRPDWHQRPCRVWVSNIKDEGRKS